MILFLGKKLTAAKSTMKYYLILNNNKIETQFAESLPLKVLQSLVGNPTESPETNLVLIEGNFGCFADNKIVLWSDADATFKKKIKKWVLNFPPSGRLILNGQVVITGKQKRAGDFHLLTKKQIQSVQEKLGFLKDGVYETYK